MSENIKVKLGHRAYSFNDQSTGLSISRGDVKSLTPRQANTVRVKRALSQGHLQIVLEKKDPDKYTSADIDKLLKKLNNQYKKGMEVSKVAKAYTLEEVKLMAQKLGYEPDTEDTVESLITTLFEEFASKEDDSKE